MFHKATYYKHESGYGLSTVWLNLGDVNFVGIALKGLILLQTVGKYNKSLCAIESIVPAEDIF